MDMSKKSEPTFWMTPECLAAVPNNILKDKAKFIWCYLHFASRQGTKVAYPSQKTIAQKVGLKHPKSVPPHIDSLVKLGLLKVSRKDKRTVNRYQVVSLAELEVIISCLQTSKDEAIASLPREGSKPLPPYIEKNRENRRPQYMRA